MQNSRRMMCAALALGLGCGDDGASELFGPGESGADDGGSDGGGDGGDDGDDGGSGADDGGGGGPKYDVDPGDGGGGDGGSCVVTDGMDAPGECEEQAPADSFNPEVQWSWEGPNGDVHSATTPLVANLTDDNGDGEIDLCDVPDIVVVAAGTITGPGAGPARMYALDGETGSVHFAAASDVYFGNSPALGDIDGDGLPELVTLSFSGLLSLNLVAFEHDGTVKWVGDPVDISDIGFNATALADLDNDGDVEGIVGVSVFDHNGKILWNAPRYITVGDGGAPTAADLDGDGDLEVIHGHMAFHHDGAVYYDNTEVTRGMPQVANLDADPEPEVLILSMTGISVLEHDGRTKYRDLTPSGDPATGLNWLKPATVHDFDGDLVSEFAAGSRNNYAVYEADGTLAWKAVVQDETGSAAGTAFDFLGDGIAEAMYADEHDLFVYDGKSGNVLLTVRRGSLTGIEYPVVADVDNDRSAEIVVVSNIEQGTLDHPAPTVQVIRDAQDRWIQPRRIWNQHTYHVTNVREDGTIPQFEQPNWESLNTFRTNAQIEGGGVCIPPVG